MRLHAYVDYSLTYCLIRLLADSLSCLLADAAAAANTKAKKHYKTRWAAKNFDSYSGIYLNNVAAIIAATAAAADTRAKKHYKTRWAGKNFDFYSRIYLKIRLQ